MSASPRPNCQRCGSALPEAAPGDLCPRCVIGNVMDGADSTMGMPETTLEPELTHPGADRLEGSTLGPGGRYKILQAIGEGGFGNVYMAEQIKPVRRRVALKILKAGMDTRQVVARFEAERQALAMMDHPNIAKVLDGGETEQGRPFFVMELVRGTPITSFCDREQLAPVARLKLFIEVCRAVQHAHQKGIIHRDLKPSNILVTMPDGAEPVPKVIDFGVAKAMESNLTDKTLFTRFEQMIGTPAYMSPEQAGTEGAPDIDTRADIYALGVLLYELLTDTTPIDSATLESAAFDEVRRILREDEAPRPSARLSSLELDRRTTIAKSRGIEAAGLGRQLRGDLDWIVMKAIEKDRRRRYDTANALAADVERHLADEPVLASPPSASYRFSKFIRRNRTGVTVSAMIVLTLMAGVIVASWGLVQARAAKSKAEENARVAEQAEAEATRSADNMRQILTFLKKEFLSPANPGINPDPNLKLREAVAHAGKSLDEKTFDDPLIEAEIRLTLADGLKILARHREAEPHYRRAVHLLSESLGATNPQTTEARTSHAFVLSQSGRHAEAGMLQKELVAHWEQHAGPDSPATLRAKLDLAQYLMAAGHARKGSQLHLELYPVQERVLGKSHPLTLNCLTRIISFYEAYDKDWSTAAEWHKRLDPAAISKAGNLEAIRRLGEMRHADNNSPKHILFYIKESLEEVSHRKGNHHPDTLLLRLEYLIALSIDPRSRAAGAAALQLLIADLKAILGDTHPAVANALRTLIEAEYPMGNRDRMAEMMKSEFDRFRSVAPVGEVELFAMVYFGYFGTWDDACEYYLSHLSGRQFGAMRSGAIAAVAARNSAAFDRCIEAAIETYGTVDDPYTAGELAIMILAGLHLPDVDRDKLLDIATPFAERCLAGTPERPRSQVIAMRLALQRGDVSRALELADRISGPNGSRRPDTFDGRWCRIVRALAQHRLGRITEAQEILEHELASFRDYDSRRMLWWDHFVPLAMTLDKAEREIFGILASPPRTAPERYRSSDQTYHHAALSYCAKAHLWEDACGNAQCLIDESPESARPWVRLSYPALLLKTGQNQKYRDYRKNWLQWAFESENDVNKECSSLMYLLQPVDKDDQELDLVLGFARSEFNDDAWMPFVRALADYRMGRFNEALEELDNIPEEGGYLTPCTNRLRVLATASQDDLAAAWSHLVKSLSDFRSAAMDLT